MIDFSKLQTSEHLSLRNKVEQIDGEIEVMHQEMADEFEEISNAAS